jgi:hypothetical protein
MSKSTDADDLIGLSVSLLADTDKWAGDLYQICISMCISAKVRGSLVKSHY